MLTKIYELMYYIQSKPYYVVYVTKNGRRIKRFIQLAASNKNGEDVFLVCNPLKSAWFKPDAKAIIIDGLKFLCFMDVDNAIPLRFEESTEIITGDIINKEVKKITIKEDMDKQKQNLKSGKSQNIVEITFPPTVLHQMIEAHFIKKILSVDRQTNDYVFWIIIVCLIAFGIIGYIWLKGQGTPVPL